MGMIFDGGVGWVFGFRVATIILRRFAVLPSQHFIGPFSKGSSVVWPLESWAYLEW